MCALVERHVRQASFKKSLKSIEAAMHAIKQVTKTEMELKLEASRR